MLSVDPPLLQVESLVRRFGRAEVLRGISLVVRPGELHLVVGPNGAGKSTFLRLVAGLARPTEGTVRLGERSPRGDPQARREVGFLSHPSLLYDELSGLENLRYFAALYGIRDDQRCRAAITAVGLDPALTRRVDQYSQGMRQRLSLARAIMHSPKILLLDEPFSNVDSASAREIVSVLAKMRAEGKTIFIVTHQAALLERVADEFVWMAAGQISKRALSPKRILNWNAA